MRILVVGAGAIGLWLTARLVPAGHEVTLVARGRIAESLEAEGLRSVVHGEVTTLRNFALVASIEHAVQPGFSYDFAALATKAYDVAGAAEEFERATASDPRRLPARVICFQNGLGSEEIVAARLGGNRVLAATVTVPVAVLGPGMVGARRDRGGVGLAALPGEKQSREGEEGRGDVMNPSPPFPPNAAGIASAFKEAGFHVETYPDYRSMLWSKLLLNMLGNATSAILDMPPGAVYADRRLFELERAAVREALAVMRAMHVCLVDLPGYPLSRIVPWLVRLPRVVLQPLVSRVVAGGRGSKMPSLYLDLAAGRRKTEVSYLNGAVARYGRAVGVATPANRVVADVLEGLAQNRLRWEDFRRQPDRLLVRVAGIS